MNTNLSRVLLWTFLLASYHTAIAAPEYLNSGKVLPTTLPFSEAVKHGNTLYLSGQIPNVPGQLKLVEGGIAEQSKQVMDNIKVTLEAHGYSMNNLIKCTVMLDDIDEWGAFNEVYATYFTEHFPARSAFEAAGLAVGAKLEVECIAAVE